MSTDPNMMNNDLTPVAVADPDTTLQPTPIVAGTDRRAFIATILAASAAYMVSDAEILRLERKPWATFWEHGESLSWSTQGLSIAEARKKRLWAREQLIARANALLPAGTRFEIRGRVSHYGRTGGWAWYAAEQMQDDPDWATFEAVDAIPVFREGGYQALGGYLAEGVTA